MVLFTDPSLVYGKHPSVQCVLVVLNLSVLSFLHSVIVLIQCQHAAICHTNSLHKQSSFQFTIYQSQPLFFWPVLYILSVQA